MQISEEQIEKYMAVYLEEFGHPVDKARARDELTALVTYMNAVWKFQNKINYA
ncbi:MAG: hypothetical protein WDK96_01440 [Candidatus Paceibacterota bacterium]|jgi:hypothetical protein